MNEVMILTLVFALIGFLLIGISIPLILERVPPNNFYGFRTKKTLSDTRIWYEANRISGNDLLIAGTLIFVTSLVFLFFGREADPKQVLITLLCVYLLSIAGAVWHSAKALKRM